jgi:CRISPR/Cas system-associated exonuclease Cas4 (RecB family)
VAFPVDHLSANSITKFIRCPRQWQESYVYKSPFESNSNLVIGSAVHLALSRQLKGEDIGDYFGDAVSSTLEGDEKHSGATGIDWKTSPEVSENLARKHLYDYERYGKHLRVIDTEKEISLDIPGVPIPIVGFVDIVCEDRLVDIKTTGYFKRSPEINPEWKVQANIYQLYEEKPFEFHVLTRSKTNPVVVPSGVDDQLYLPPPPRRQTELFLRQIYDVMQFYVDRFGHDEWPGNVTHPWAAKYCPLGSSCCQR